ncbi:hypothetical protein SAMN05216203_0139 [Marinobacter daqiaonensis]|uniref:Uncharacterized protein n=1 Tax=Marinobacter daqiaonensis TaxID=650891 RepID=A0A1I6GIH7_9GAMM|nr:hypothetical protein [Marinobacter daqiaonensis]SFR41992.1 hypothetical protein SAMN05216203_0139 [Marinobacter daqiaonensis]
MDIQKTGLSLALAFALTGTSVVQAKDSDTSMEEVKQETAELGKALKSYGAEQKDEAEAAINRTLDHIDQRIATLEEELSRDWDTMSDATRERARKTLESLRQQRARAEGWLDQLESSSASAWEEARRGFTNAYEELAESWKRAEEALDEPSQNDNTGDGN